jgi:hypothetical protein
MSRSGVLHQGLVPDGADEINENLTDRPSLEGQLDSNY